MKKAEIFSTMLITISVILMIFVSTCFTKVQIISEASELSDIITNMQIYEMSEKDNVTDRNNSKRGSVDDENAILIKKTGYTGWKNFGGKKAAYYVNGKKRYKLTAYKGTYICKKFTRKKWVLCADKWLPEYKGEKYYVGENGKVALKFFKGKYKNAKKCHTVWEYTGSKWIKQKNKLLKYGEKRYLIGSDGKLIYRSGWHTLSSTRAAYVCRKGYVSEYVSYDRKSRCSIFRKGSRLKPAKKGLYSAVIKEKPVYYYVKGAGRCVTGKKEIADYQYVFDKYGRGEKERFLGALNWDYDKWMSRVFNHLLGVTNIRCNEFVADALRYAGDDDANTRNAIKYNGFEDGGIVLNSANNVTAWIHNRVTGYAVRSNGDEWDESAQYEMNKNIVDFAYDELETGDLIVYYKNGSPSHIGIYMGYYEDKDAVREKLLKEGVSESVAESCIKDWGLYYDNEASYWCIQGGMGYNNSVYIANNCYAMPAGGTMEYARKIIKMNDK